MDLIKYGLWYQKEYKVSKDQEDFIERICIIAADYTDKDNEWICQMAAMNDIQKQWTKK
jgi:hypothetical protein